MTLILLRLSLVAIAFIGIFIWLYRPGSAKIYEQYSKIALKDETSE